MNDDTPAADDAIQKNRNGEPIERDPNVNNGRPLPPRSTQIKPGERRNPGGRRPAGASIREWYNILAADENMTPAALREIVNDPKSHWTKIAAAQQALDTAERPNMATFEKVRAGEETIEEAHNRGLPTDQIKKFKLKVRATREKSGNIVTETESEIELHERASNAIDRLHDRTEGKPVQAIDLDANIAQEMTVIRARRIPDQSAYTKSPVPAEESNNADAGNP
jgi:hypothetical protein